jgi:hypothetical protein
MIRIVIVTELRDWKEDSQGALFLDPEHGWITRYKSSSPSVEGEGRQRELNE